LSTPPHKPEASLVQHGKRLTPLLLRVAAIHGCLFAVRPDAFNAHGGFHEFFAMHGEHVELCAWLNDNEHQLAYLTHLSLLHDDRDTLQHSVMRNLPGRERFLLATVIAMIARNSLYEDHPLPHLFIDTIRRKWLPNVGIPSSSVEPAISILLGIGRLLRMTDGQHFSQDARAYLINAPLDQRTRQLFTDAIIYTANNLALLQPLGTAATRQPLYELPS
jgi:hypothetical protein